MFGTLVLALPTWLFGSGRDEGGAEGRGPAESLHAHTPSVPRDPLLTRLREDDATALAEMHTLYAAALWRHAYRYVRDRDAAEDIVQDVFVALWNRRRELSTELATRPYLYISVRNRALKHIRHDVVVARTQGAHELVESAHGTERAVAEADLEALVRRTLAELPERQRSAIELRWLRELGYTEIAAILGVSEAAVRKLVAKAMIRLESLQQSLRER